MKPILLIHGGAGSRKPGARTARETEKSLKKIVSAIYPILRRGGSALEAVAAAVELLENDPIFNAGKGSKIQADGKIRMSASIMDGNRRRFAGCINVARVKNPVRLAEKLLETDSRVLAEKGAEDFARKAKMPFASPYTRERVLEHQRKKKGKTGTVGAVALDRKGRIAAATSTGGRGYEYPHRVSDSATAAGNFANPYCAASATGTGEEIVELGVCASIATQVETGIPLAKAAQSVLATAKKQNRQFGFISLDRKGNFFASTTTPNLTWAMIGEKKTEIHP